MFRENAPVSGVESRCGDIESMLSRLQSRCSQFDIDGTNNVWIVKPGAKSRGRGVYMCLKKTPPPLFIFRKTRPKMNGYLIIFGVQIHEKISHQ